MRLIDQEVTRQKFNRLWGDLETTSLPLPGKKYVIFSDIHLGDGGGADDFVHNEEALLNALSYYHAEEYAIILLGDIEDTLAVRSAPHCEALR